MRFLDTFADSGGTPIWAVLGGGGATLVDFGVGRWGDEIPLGSGVAPDLVEIRVPPESTNVLRF